MSDKASGTHKQILPQHEKLMECLGGKIRNYRKKEGLSYKEMAKRIGISRNNYNLMENGKIYFKFSTLLKILEYHSISVENFFSFKDDEGDEASR